MNAAHLIFLFFNPGHLYQQTVADNLGLADARSLSQGKAFSDAAGITDAMSRVQFFVRAFADALGITDTAGRLYLKTFSDSEGQTDAVAFSHGFGRNIAEAMNIADAMALAQRKSLSDSEGLTDAVARHYGRLISNAMGITDAASFKAAWHKILPIPSMHWKPRLMPWERDPITSDHSQNMKELLTQPGSSKTSCAF